MSVYIGCHLSSAGGFEEMGKRALEIEADTFAFFTRNPRGGKSKKADPEDAAKLRKIMAQNGFGKLVAHAPYTMNACSKDERVREFARMCMKEDLEKMELLPGNYYNFHPGSHVGQGAENGIRMISDTLNEVLWEEQKTTVLLETMAGKGSEIGSRFEELAEIIRKVNLSDHVGVCLDTCHVNDGGYDIVNHLDEVLEEFDRCIGLSKLKALHINDSMNPLGAHKDRHARIGEGAIGKEGMVKILCHPALQGLPCILETPQKDLQGYGAEIRMLREAIRERNFEKEENR
nr:deoxyribonuclease IV [uncultured Mogibacterium sp.]